MLGLYNFEDANKGVALCAISFALGAVLLFLSGAAVVASERVFYIQAIEHKGKTNIKKEPFPGMPLANEAGMKIKPVTGEGSWAVEAYGFSPAQITVIEGDEVVLNFIGINGAHHGISVESVGTLELRRGTMGSVEFTASKPGIINFSCSDHAPNMIGQIVVLARK